MRIRMALGMTGMAVLLSGCQIVRHAFCGSDCDPVARNTSSLVSFLYPDGQVPPPSDTIPQLHVPLRVGLAFLPSNASNGAAPLEAAQKQELLERIKKRFASRPFVSDIVMIPDYYLDNARGIAGLDGVQRLYNVDVMALVSYDQITHQDDNNLSMGYLTIVGAYVLRGTNHQTATLVDLAVVDPATRSLVIRAGGTDTQSDDSSLVHLERDTRKASARGFDQATTQMIDHFDAALTAFEADVRAGKANVQVVERKSSGGFLGGGGAVETWGIAGLILLLGSQMLRRSKPPLLAKARI